MWLDNKKFYILLSTWDEGGYRYYTAFKQNPCFGNKQIRELALTFNIQANTSVQEFCKFMLSANDDDIPKDFQPFKTAANTLIMSTVECEWLFSTMNIIIWYKKFNAMKTMAGSMFIYPWLVLQLIVVILREWLGQQIFYRN
jgi:hypothetical protein